MTPPHGESIAERFAALAALRAEGLIRHLRLSNIDADHLREARAIAPVAAVQNAFHLAGDAGHPWRRLPGSPRGEPGARSIRLTEEDVAELA